MFDLYADKTQLAVRSREAVTSGSVNACEARFEFSPDWDGLERVAVFRAGAETRSVRLDGGGACAVPWEVLVKPDVRLLAGVYGTRGGELVLPTVWASLGTILEGAAPGEDAQPPTPGLWKQELAGKGDGLAYDGLTLSLTSGGEPLATVQIVGGGGGGQPHQFGHGLKVFGNTVSVDSVSDFTGDNTLPITAQAVQATVGNIEVLLGTI